MYSLEEFLHIVESAGTAVAVDSKAGVYSWRELDPTTKSKLNAWIKENDIKNPVPPNLLHVSVITSLTPVHDYQPDTKKLTIYKDKMTITKLGNGLIIKFPSPEIDHQWDKAKELGARMRWPSSLPHVTITYNFNEPITKERFTPLDFHFVLEPEETRPYDETWVHRHGLAEQLTLDEALANFIGSPEVKAQFVEIYGEEWFGPMYAFALNLYEQYR